MDAMDVNVETVEAMETTKTGEAAETVEAMETVPPTSTTTTSTAPHTSTATTSPAPTLYGTIPAVMERTLHFSSTPLEALSDHARNLLSKGLAPVKEEFVIPYTPKRALPAADESAPASEPPSKKSKTLSGASGEAAASSSKVAKASASGGGFGARSKKQKTLPVTHPFCLAHAAGMTCSYGETCKRSHDLQALLAVRHPDLDGECPQVKVFGFCRFGLLCRWGLTHVGPDGVTNANADPDFAVFADEKNVLEFSTLTAIRGFDGRKKKKKKKKPNPFETPRAERAEAALNAAAAAAKARAKDPEREKEEEPVFDFMAFRKEVLGFVDDDPRARIDFDNKLYLAPLTTVGTLPFRRICTGLGADITCGEMALVSSLLQGKRGEWALMRAHKEEQIFGVQVCGGWKRDLAQACEIINMYTPSVSFVDLNVCCPIDLVYQKGMGSALLGRRKRLVELVRAGASVLDAPMTMKVRTGVTQPMVDQLIPDLAQSGLAALSIHGRTRKQRYSKHADWEYMIETAKNADLPVIGNGDIFSYEEADQFMSQPGLSSIMVARGALIKPWIFTELKEKRHWDISAAERWQILEDYVEAGLIHWGSDERGVEQTRKYLLEWLSFLYRYIPVGVLEVLPQQLTARAPAFVGRNDLETLLASPNAADWVRISERLLGPVPPGFTFVPKHKSNAYPDQVQG